MERVLENLREAYPEFRTGLDVNVESFTDHVVGRIRPALLLLTLAVFFVLLIAAVNVANLMLTRTTAEHREIAIRTALGAGRGRVARQKLTESVLLALAGGALGVSAATGITQLLLAVAPENLPQVDHIALDTRVLGFAIALSLVTGVLFGIAPALRAARADVATTLKEGSRGSTASLAQQRLRAGFTVTQLAFSLMLLISAGLMLTTFSQLMRVDPGFEASGVATMKLALPRSAYPTRTEQAALYDRLLPTLQGLPGVNHVGATRFLPFEDHEWTWSVLIEGQPPPQQGEKRGYGYHAVTPDYFRTMGITLERGRYFNDFDRAGAPHVAIVNEAFVRRFFPAGEHPLGRRMAISSRPDNLFEIVGVVEDVNQYSLDVEPIPAYYLPYTQLHFDAFLREMNLVVRTSGKPADIVPSLRGTIRAIDRTIVVSDILAMDERVTRSVARTRFAMVLLGVFAAVALSLAAVGVYGLIAYSVRQRAHEIGVRMALGAEPGNIMRHFVGTGLKLVAAGLGVGIVGAVVLTRFQASLLFGVGSVDPMTYGAVSALLCAVAVLATLAPARRASRVDPVQVLRDE
jgi:putative ABC transport system permease protein